MKLFSYILFQFVHCWCIKKTTDFCKLTLYPATLQKLFVMSKNFLELLGIRSCHL
jgi:hypothetical protein